MKSQRRCQVGGAASFAFVTLALTVQYSSQSMRLHAQLNTLLSVSTEFCPWPSLHVIGTIKLTETCQSPQHRWRYLPFQGVNTDAFSVDHHLANNWDQPTRPDLATLQMTRLRYCVSFIVKCAELALMHQPRGICWPGLGQLLCCHRCCIHDAVKKKKKVPIACLSGRRSNLVLGNASFFRKLQH